MYQEIRLKKSDMLMIGIKKDGCIKKLHKNKSEWDFKMPKYYLILIYDQMNTCWIRFTKYLPDINTFTSLLILKSLLNYKRQSIKPTFKMCNTISLGESLQKK